MLQVIVAASPFPDLGPEAVVSHGSGSVVLRMNPCAGGVHVATHAAIFSNNRRCRRFDI
jgi:hypothetical protein